ncbi:hypothetical protein D3C73_1632910 [compost metagenome]
MITLWGVWRGWLEVNFLVGTSPGVRVVVVADSGIRDRRFDADARAQDRFQRRAFDCVDSIGAGGGADEENPAFARGTV